MGRDCHHSFRKSQIMPNLIANAKTITGASRWSVLASWIALIIAIGVCRIPKNAIASHSHLIRLHRGRWAFSDSDNESVEPTGGVPVPC